MEPQDLVTFQEAREAAEVLVEMMRKKDSSPEDRVYCAAEIIHMYSREVRIDRDRAAVQKVADAAGAMGLGISTALPGFAAPVLEHLKEAVDGQGRELPGLPCEREEDITEGGRSGGEAEEPGGDGQQDQQGAESASVPVEVGSPGEGE